MSLQAVKRSPKTKTFRCVDCGRRVERADAIGDEQGEPHCIECVERAGGYSNLPDGAALALMEEHGWDVMF